MEKYSPDTHLGKEWTPHKPQLREQLLAFWKERFPDSLPSSLKDQQEQEERVIFCDQRVNNQEVATLLKEYGLKPITVELIEGGLFRIEVKNHFSAERLPEGYGYKGGAARALLLRSLGIHPDCLPRDIDVVRSIENEPEEGMDTDVARRFMADDFEHGYGVEVIADQQQYFATRDLTINELFATDSHIIATKQCLFDTIRHIIRLTEYERTKDLFGMISHKMLAKLLRFYAESIYKYDEAAFKDIEGWEFEKYSIDVFWLAIQLDRAFEVSADLAERYVIELKQRHQIPEAIKDASEAAEYLLKFMTKKAFQYRHVPVLQMEKEYEWIEEVFDARKKPRRKYSKQF